MSEEHTGQSIMRMMKPLWEQAAREEETWQAPFPKGIDETAAWLRWHWDRATEEERADFLGWVDRKQALGELTHQSQLMGFYDDTKSVPASFLETAEKPTSDPEDYYVTAQAAGEAVWATSWSGWRVKLDAKTGRILESEFVK